MLPTDNVGGVKIVNVLQRLIDHVVIRKTGFPFNELATSSVTISGLSWLRKATKLLNELTVGPDGKVEEGTVYLREMNGASLMLEIAEFLEVNEDNALSTATTISSASLDVVELMEAYSRHVGERHIQLACEPRPFNYRLVDGGPDQRQSHLPTKIAAAIEFRMELSAHACIQRRAEKRRKLGSMLQSQNLRPPARRQNRQRLMSAMLEVNRRQLKHRSRIKRNC